MPVVLGGAALYAAKLALLLSIPFAIAGFLAALAAGVIAALFGAEDSSVQQLPRIVLVGVALAIAGVGVGRAVLGFQQEILALIGDR